MESSQLTSDAVRGRVDTEEGRGEAEEVVEVRYNMTLWGGVGIGGSGCDEMGFPPSNELLEMSHVCHPCER
jgi:hypothetical protein